MRFIQRNLKHANRDIKELAYASLARSIFEYSSTVWDPFYQNDIDWSEMVQRRAARFVLNDNKPISSVTNMVSRHGWKPIEDRRREHRPSLLRKIINGLAAMPAERVRFPDSVFGHSQVERLLRFPVEFY